MPCLRIGSGTLALSYSLRIVQSPYFLCVCCYSIVGLWLCLCGRVVSLWNSGDGLCWVEGRVVFTVYASSCVVVSVVVCVMAVCDDSACFVFSYCVVGCGMAGCGGVWSRCVSSSSLFFSSSSSLLVVFGGVRAQLCEHARYPRTPLCSLVVFLPLLSFSLPAFLCVSSFLLLWNGGG